MPRPEILPQFKATGDRLTLTTLTLRASTLLNEQRLLDNQRKAFLITRFDFFGKGVVERAKEALWFAVIEEYDRSLDFSVPGPGYLQRVSSATVEDIPLDHDPSTRTRKSPPHQATLHA